MPERYKKAGRLRRSPLILAPFPDPNLICCLLNEAQARAADVCRPNDQVEGVESDGSRSTHGSGSRQDQR